jgi:Ca2+-binding RTX toxin-like protein
MATITGTNGRNELGGSRLADLIRGLGGNDELEGRGGNDTIDGGRGNDEIDGDDGNDRLIGNAGNDDIDGGSGHDLLWGGGGRDHLDGGSGNDRLWGGLGSDVFEFERHDGADRIEDFQDGIDRIDLDDFDFTSAARALSYADQVGNHVVFAFGAGDRLTVMNTDLAELSGADLIL